MDEGRTIPDTRIGWLIKAKLAGDDIQVTVRLLSHTLVLTRH